MCKNYYKKFKKMSDSRTHIYAKFRKSACNITENKIGDNIYL